ncbi:hypothetical protein BDD12DRAFT_869341 [Trichophaea hybrida]|nr:hypothetical protein BDD12DRAFT_869341 [Trichophaea hybrida]
MSTPITSLPSRPKMPRDLVQMQEILKSGLIDKIIERANELAFRMVAGPITPQERDHNSTLRLRYHELVARYEAVCDGRVEKEGNEYDDDDWEDGAMLEIGPLDCVPNIDTDPSPSPIHIPETCFSAQLPKPPTAAPGFLDPREFMQQSIERIEMRRLDMEQRKIDMEQRKIDLEKKRFDMEQYRMDKEERREMVRIAREDDRLRAERESWSSTVLGLCNTARHVCVPVLHDRVSANGIRLRIF